MSEYGIKQETIDNIADLAMQTFGLTHMAYVKPVTNGVEQGFGVFAADGTQLAVFATAEAALFTARQHDLEPTLLH